MRSILIALFFVTAGDSLFAQIPLTPPKVEKDSPATHVADLSTIENKRQAVSEELAKAKNTLQETKAQVTDNSIDQTEKASDQVDSLVQLDAIISQQRAAEAKQLELSDKQAENVSALEKLKQTGPEEKPPFSFLLVDSLNDDLIEKERRSETVSSRLASAQETYAQAKQLATEKENERLLAKEAFEKAKSVEEKNALGAKLAKAEQSAKTATESFKLRALELDNEKLIFEIHKTETDLLKEKIRWISQNVEFTEADLNSRLVEIEKRESQIDEKLKTAELSLDSLERSWIAAKQSLERENGDKTLPVAKLESLRLSRLARQSEVAFLNWQRQNLSENKTIWKDRFRIISRKIPHDELKSLESDYQKKLEEIQRARKVQLLSIDDLRMELASLAEQISGLDPTQKQLVSIYETQREIVQEKISILDSRVVAIDRKLQLLNKVLAEIGLHRNSVSVAQWFAKLWANIKSIWNTVVISVDENPITIGKITLGFFLVIAGFWLSKFVSRFIGKRFLPRFGINHSAAAAFQSIIFYLLILSFTLAALRMVNVPLTVFTFLGGAAAIGLGFGSQNVMKNFISGLIILAERPVRVGDLIEVDNFTGTVERIGARSTTIRTGNNMEIIVPNGTFLENNVINWTLSDSRIRFQIDVGVAYGSPTREVANLLKRAADEHGKIQKNPAPFVWFTNFGDNSLNFQLHAWINQRTLSERKFIESDLRFQIDNLFREAGIVIAFPQRDLHLDTNSPLDIRLLTPEVDSPQPPIAA